MEFLVFVLLQILCPVARIVALVTFMGLFSRVLELVYFQSVSSSAGIVALVTLFSHKSAWHPLHLHRPMILQGIVQRATTSETIEFNRMVLNHHTL